MTKTNSAGPIIGRIAVTCVLSIGFLSNAAFAGDCDQYDQEIAAARQTLDNSYPSLQGSVESISGNQVYVPNGLDSDIETKLRTSVAKLTPRGIGVHGERGVAGRASRF